MSGKHNRLIAALGASSVALWALFVKLGFVGFVADPVWYVDPSRNWARGLGLVAKLAMPAQVSLMPDPADLPTRLLLHGPLAPMLLGSAYWLFGITDLAPIALSAALTMATGLLIWRVGRELASERVGLLAAALFWTNVEVISGLTSGFTEPPFILLMTAGWTALWLSSRDEPGAERWLAAAGACLALASACRLAAQSYWGGFFLAVVWVHGLRPRRLVAFVAGFFIALLPLMLYFKRHLGFWLYSPGYYALCWSPSFPGFKSATSFLPITSLQAVARYPMDFVQKSVTGPLYASIRVLANTGGGWWLVAAAFSLCARHVREVSKFRAIAAFVVLPVYAFNAVFSYGAGHYLAPLFPPLALLAAVFLFRFIDENGLASTKLRARTTAGVLAMLLLAPTLLQLKDDAKSKPARLRLWQDNAALADFVSRRVEASGIVWTDSPHLVVWQADRPAVGLTATIEDGEKLLAKLARPPAALLFTTNWLYNPDFHQSWRDAFAEGRGAFGYDRCEPWRGGEVSALLCLRAP